MGTLLLLKIEKAYLEPINSVASLAANTIKNAIFPDFWIPLCAGLPSDPDPPGRRLHCLLLLRDR